jgi:alkylhydroperoxidase/carboxymuconolactone decarboxylase family protein YurZ
MTAGDVPDPTSTALSPEQEELKAAFIEKRGYWTELWQQVLALSPDYFRAYLEFSAVPWTQNYLDPRTKEFIYVAITSSTTHLFEPGIRVHIANAFGYGATAAEVMEVFQLVSLLGIHTATVAAPILEQEIARAAAEKLSVD